jgi:hypothetical protein
MVEGAKTQSRDGGRPATRRLTSVACPEAEPARFIPFRRRAIIEFLCAEGKLGEADLARFRELAKVVEAYYHFQFHHKLETLKDAYHPFNPDLDVESSGEFSPEQMARHLECLTATLDEVLNDANFEEISRAQINEAIERESLFSIKLKLDFDDFVDCRVYGRGNVVKKETIRRWLLWKEVVDVPTFERVVLFMRFKERAYFQAQKRGGLNFEPGSTQVKLFKNMPHHDLEILFPNTQLQMHLRDKLLLGVPATLGAIPILITKVLPQIPLIIGVFFGYQAAKGAIAGDEYKAILQALIALAVFGGYCYRQWDKFKNRRIQYLKQLTESLYTKNLDNNAGVFHRLIDSAEEEEFKEAIIAYYFLVTEGPRSSAELDARIEAWFKEKHGKILNFEINGALEKLIKLGICESENEVYSAKPVLEAAQIVDSHWDSFFDFDDGDATKEALAEATKRETKSG